MSLMQLAFPSEQKFAGLLFYLMRERGIHIWENRAFVITTAHSEEDFKKLLTAFRESLQAMVDAGFLPPPSGSGSKSSSHDPDTSGGTPARQIPVLAAIPAAVDQFPSDRSAKGNLGGRADGR